ncbi:MAG TPA: GIY-YIG nuclease family protein [Rhizomicrobium sp.]
MREHLYYVYILASRRNGTLYIGVTNNIMRRTWEHKTGLVEALRRNTACIFSSGTNCSKLSIKQSRAKSG